MIFNLPAVLDGTEPGRLDPTQKKRLLADPSLKLSFAVYDPLAATGHGLVPTAVATDDSIQAAKPKRIVIETPPGGGVDGHWRFIPAARRAPGVPDEGTWPRLVIMCGEYMIFSQEQWDIHKLDPVFDCYLPGESACPIINRKATSDADRQPPTCSKRHPPYDSSNIDRDNEPSGRHRKARKTTTLPLEPTLPPKPQPTSKVHPSPRRPRVLVIEKCRASPVRTFSPSEAARTPKDGMPSEGASSPSEAAWTASEGGVSPTEHAFSYAEDEAALGVGEEEVPFFQHSSSPSQRATSLLARSPSRLSFERSLPPSPSKRAPSVRRRSPSPAQRTASVRKRSPSPTEDATSIHERSPSPSEDTTSVQECSPSPTKDATSVQERSPSPTKDATSVRKCSPSPTEDATSIHERSPSPTEDATSVHERSPSPAEDTASVHERSPSPAEGTASVHERSSLPSEEAASVHERSPLPPKHTTSDRERLSSPSEGGSQPFAGALSPIERTLSALSVEGDDAADGTPVDFEDEASIEAALGFLQDDDASSERAPSPDHMPSPSEHVPSPSEHAPSPSERGLSPMERVPSPPPSAAEEADTLSEREGCTQRMFSFSQAPSKPTPPPSGRASPPSPSIVGYKPSHGIPEMGTEGDTFLEHAPSPEQAFSPLKCPDTDDDPHHRRSADINVTDYGCSLDPAGQGCASKCTKIATNSSGEPTQQTPGGDMGVGARPDPVPPSTRPHTRKDAKQAHDEFAAAKSCPDSGENVDVPRRRAQPRIEEDISLFEPAPSSEQASPYGASAAAEADRHSGQSGITSEDNSTATEPIGVRIKEDRHAAKANFSSADVAWGAVDDKPSPNVTPPTSARVLGQNCASNSAQAAKMPPQSQGTSTRQRFIDEPLSPDLREGVEEPACSRCTPATPTSRVSNGPDFFPNNGSPHHAFEDLMEEILETGPALPAAMTGSAATSSLSHEIMEEILETGPAIPVGASDPGVACSLSRPGVIDPIMGDGQPAHTSAQEFPHKRPAEDPLEQHAGDALMRKRQKCHLTTFTERMVEVEQQRRQTRQQQRRTTRTRTQRQPAQATARPPSPPLPSRQPAPPPPPRSGVTSPLKYDPLEREPQVPSSVDPIQLERDAEHLAMLQESRQKLAKLEQDRAELEAAQRRREAEVAAAAEAAAAHQSAGAERQHPATEAEKRHAAEVAAEAERQAREAAEAGRRDAIQREFQEHQEQARRKWCHTFWTSNTAIRNHFELIATFDEVKTFKGTKPNFYAIPWPVLTSWTTLLPEHITDEAVQQFLVKVEERLSFNEFKTYISKAHKRFHPNRWDARVILSADNPELTEMLRKANQMVIQMLGPLYDDLFRAKVVHDSDKERYWYRFA